MVCKRNSSSIGCWYTFRRSRRGFAVIGNKVNICSLDVRITSGEDKKTIMSRWRAAAVQDAVKLGLKDLQIVDPFSDLDPMLDDSMSDSPSLDTLCGISEDEIAAGYSQTENETERAQYIKYKAWA